MYTVSLNSELLVDDVCLNIKDKEILKHVTMGAKSGDVTAMMGPTGSGKTTLLNVISGRQKQNAGKVTLDGKSFNKHRRRRLGFVQQQDVFFTHLTLAETLSFTANIRMPESITAAEKQARIDVIVQSLHLGKCLNTVIGNVFVKGLSGGEKKRASIACELLTDPDILLLDEPTSGVDSFTAHAIAICLQECAKKFNKIVLLSIHQPSSKIYHMFDALVLLTDGQIAYFGKGNDVLPYFEGFNLHCGPNYNPADFLMENLHLDKEILDKIVAKVSTAGKKLHYSSSNESHSENGSIMFLGKSTKTDQVAIAFDTDKESNGQLENLLSHHDDGRKKRHDDQSPEKWTTSWTTQYKELTLRSVREQIRVLKEGYSLVQTICVAVLCALLYFQVGISLQTARDVFGLNYFFVGYWTFIPAMNVISTYPGERAVIAKERSSGSYRLSAYYLATMTGQLPETLILPTIMYILFFWMGGFGGAEQFFPILAVMLIQTFCCYGLGLVISVLCHDLRMAVTTLFCYLISTYLLGGFFSQNEPYWMTWIKYCSIFYYPYAYAVSLIMGGNLADVPCNQTSVELYPKCNSNITTFVTSSDVLEQGNIFIGSDKLFIIILLYAVAIRGAGYLALRFKRETIV